LGIILTCLKAPALLLRATDSFDSIIRSVMLTTANGLAAPEQVLRQISNGAISKGMRAMLRLAFVLIGAISTATWAEAETIDVKYYGRLDLAPFACTDLTRSSFINRACYDKTKRFMVVQLNSVYYPYCEMPVGTYDAFLAAPSMGKYYNANIKGTGSDGPFDCRTHTAPKY
jgi:hypothetical protein